MSDATSADLGILADFELTVVALDHLSVTRSGFTSEPGSYNWSTEYRFEIHQELVLLSLSNAVAITDADDDPVAEIHVAHVVGFRRSSGGPLDATSEVLDVLLRVGRMTVQPLLREKVLTLSADLGIPPLTLPLLRRDAMPEAKQMSDAMADPESEHV